MPASTADTLSLSAMEKISRYVSTYYPPKSAVSTNTAQQPRLIIIASWTGARSIHIIKYISEYQKLYPLAQILLLEADMGMTFKPSSIGPAMAPAVPIIRAIFPTSCSSTAQELLIHIFSNGGASTVAALYEQYRVLAAPGEDQILPRHVTVLDSAPGSFSIPVGARFFSTGLSPLQRAFAAPFLYAAVTGWSLLLATGVVSDVLAEWAKAHNVPEQVIEVRRVYIYSDKDILIDYKAVEKHAEIAKSKGFSVNLERFEGSAHVSHVRKDENRYWAIIRRTWDGKL